MDDYPSLFRSEEMSLVQLFVPTEVAHDTVYELGQLGNVQFKDLNPEVNPFQRSFVGEIRRLDEMARRVRFFSSQISTSEDVVPVQPLYDSPPIITTGSGGAKVVDELDVVLTEHESRLSKMNDSYKTLGERLKELSEARWVLRETAVFFDRAQGHREDIRTSFDESAAPLLQHDDRENQFSTSSVQFDLEFVAGTITRARMSTLERVLWRILRGNLYMNHTDIPSPFIDPVTQAEEYKNVFIIFAHGSSLLTKIRKICESMGATLYPIDANAQKREESLREVSTRLEDLEQVIYNTKQSRRAELVKIGEHIKVWDNTVKKEKKVYEVLNLFSYDVRRRTLIAEGWVPTRDIGTIQYALRNAAEQSSSSPALLSRLPTISTPPTYHRLNKFTEGFQAIMDAYGIAKYQEVNPGLFATVTFPFLFAVMFGDIGHAAIVVCAATWMILSERRLARQDLGEIMGQFFYGRYIILLMGIFSLYTGFMYNDIFSKTLHLFDSGWSFHPANSSLPDSKILGTFSGNTYPFGLDPGWHGAANNLVFVNSYKMKMSVVLGVIHMTFALCLQLPNHIKFNRPIDIWGNFVPQLLFLQSIFGYLVLTILYKWSVDWTHSETSPPSLLNMLISMFLEPGTVSPEVQLYRGQGTVQVLLVAVAGICVPWLLCLKPWWIWREMHNEKRTGYIGLASNEDSFTRAGNEDDEGNGHELEAGQSHPDGEEHEDFSEIVIHQTIHTIEFCLGCISHTASYLRLWALSLAHAQLSEVLWSMTIEGYLNPVGLLGWVALVIMGALWFGLTVGILCLMEGLSAFLHALRLHWVEANSKHFEGGGYAFTPLAFADLEKEE